MDVHVQWKLSPDVDELLVAVLKCKQELTNSCFKKNGIAKVTSCYVYASEKLVEFFKLSKLYTDTPEGTDKRMWPDASATLQGEFPQFVLYDCDVFSDEEVRVVMRFSAGDATDEEWFGTVDVT